MMAHCQLECLAVLTPSLHPLVAADALLQDIREGHLPITKSCFNTATQVKKRKPLQLYTVLIKQEDVKALLWEKGVN